MWSVVRYFYCAESVKHFSSLPAVLFDRGIEDERNPRAALGLFNKSK